MIATSFLPQGNPQPMEWEAGGAFQAQANTMKSTWTYSGMSSSGRKWGHITVPSKLDIRADFFTEHFQSQCVDKL